MDDNRKASGTKSKRRCVDLHQVLVINKIAHAHSRALETDRSSKISSVVIFPYPAMLMHSFVDSALIKSPLKCECTPEANIFI